MSRAEPASPTMEAPWPTEIRVASGGGALRISFEDGEVFTLDAELLRVESPSAEVKGHGGETPPPPAGKSHVRLTDAQAVGRYAVRLIFDDGHETGLYTWAYLHELGRDREARRRTYLERLAAAGLTR